MERQGIGRQLQKGKIPSVHDVAAVSSIIATAILLVLGGDGSTHQARYVDVAVLDFAHRIFDSASVCSVALSLSEKNAD